MALIDHFLNNSRPVSEGGNGFNRISAHNFTGGLFLWAAGDVTRANIVSAFGLDAADEVQLDQMSANYIAESTAADKITYVNKVHHALMLSETGVLNKTQAMTILGLT